MYRTQLGNKTEKLDSPDIGSDTSDMADQPGILECISNGFMTCLYNCASPCPSLQHYFDISGVYLFILFKTFGKDVS